MKKNLGIWIDSEVHKRMKARAAERGVHLYDVMDEAFRAWLNLPPSKEDKMSPRIRRIVRLLLDYESRAPGVIEGVEKMLKAMIIVPELRR